MEFQISMEMAIWDGSFKYAGKGGFGTDLVSPMKHLKRISSRALSRISFQAGLLVLALPFLNLLPKSKGFLPAVGFSSH